ncbi:restriction endonuclease [Flavobacterium arcticum]|uniref:Restriction endonuclease n=1 Tax=Flavobacterium arcticum TaxID=1784713 RepID=A0A345HEZ6_9FLAO|nr:BsuBI/PstI family type II restriction endonuclease [Flavobacterium arcticum]AXG75156.1 restriction endonuclease [Flavobacterium arcticum]KAF2511063.1 restriction endonuclease [Flavobacterium arcticum]
MQFTEEQTVKLTLAKELLEKLGLPKAQCNNRSAWVFLALADIKPNDNWAEAKSPLLPTVTIMEFIRNEYGMDYKPNSRETIRRQTLHQFEQARIIDRNRDNPARATNSKDNNYSLNKEVINILVEYPKGNWEKKILEYKNSVTELTEQYKRTREIHMIPIKTPDGRVFELSPGEHNKLHADIIYEFCSRFIGSDGHILYIGDTASSREEKGKYMLLETEYLKSLNVSPMSHDKLPDVIVYDEKNNWLFLIEAVTSHGPISPKRWVELEVAFKECKAGLVYVTAFPNQNTFRKYAADIAWETEVWIADNPSHMIHFNGDRFLGPHKKG